MTMTYDSFVNKKEKQLQISEKKKMFKSHGANIKQIKMRC